MKHTIYLFAMLYSLANMSSAISPVTGFVEGNYAGEGTWLDQNSNRGKFSAFVVMRSNGWTLARFELNDLHIYKSTLTIDANGFLSAEMLDETDPQHPIYYPGYGHCGSNYCQMTIYLYNAKLWKKLSFNPDKTISALGLIYYDDGSPNVQWEATIAPVP